MQIKEPVGLYERLRNAKKAAELCKNGRLEYIKSCCRSKTDERALATDMGHLVQIVKMQKLEDFVDRELERKADERRQKEVEKKLREAEERRQLEAERTLREAERRKEQEEQRAIKEAERKLREAEKRKEQEEQRAIKEAEKARLKQIQENQPMTTKESEKTRTPEKAVVEGTKLPTEIENKITRFLISEKHKLTDISRVIELCLSLYNRISNISVNLGILRELNIALTVVRVKIIDLIGAEDADTVLTFLVNFLVKKIRARR